MKMKRHRYTREEIKFIEDNVKGISLEELTDRFNKRFNLNVSKFAIGRVKCYRGLKSEYYHSNNIKHNKYTEEQVEFLCKNARGIPNKELTDRFNQTFNTNLSEGAIASKKTSLNLKSGMHPSQFKKGDPNPRLKPIGTISIHYNGTAFIKVKHPNTWRVYSHVLYEQYHNVKLCKGDLILFLDGNNTNFDKDNLVRITREEESQLLSLKKSYINIDKNVHKTLINIAKIKAIVIEKKSTTN